MRLAHVLTLTILLTTCANAAEPAHCSAAALDQRLPGATIVVLAEVETSTFPVVKPGQPISPTDPLKQFGTATLGVLKSWKGPYPPGSYLHVDPTDAICGGLCQPY